MDEALPRMRDAIRRFAAAAGASQKYHETITVLWMRLLADVKARGASGELADVLRAHPALADKELPLQYYSRERLFSDEARAAWVEPDRHAPSVGSVDSVIAMPARSLSVAHAHGHRDGAAAAVLLAAAADCPASSRPRPWT